MLIHIQKQMRKSASILGLCLGILVLGACSHPDFRVSTLRLNLDIGTYEPMNDNATNTGRQGFSTTSGSGASNVLTQNFETAAFAYEQGDYATAFREFESLAEQGNANSQFRLGLMYGNGLGVRQNYQTAVEWLRRAAVQGHPQAQVDLAEAYINGLGVAQSHTTAFELYSRAAAQNYAPAQFGLAEMYEKGRGVVANYDTAIDWYTRANRQGFAPAQDSLSRLQRIIANSVDR